MTRQIRAKLGVLLVVAVGVGAVLFQGNKGTDGAHVALQKMVAEIAEREDIRGKNAFIQAIVKEAETTFGADNKVTLNLKAEFAHEYWEDGLYILAHDLAEDVVETRNRLYGAEHPATLDALHDLGEITRALGDYDAAYDLQYTVLAVRQRTQGVEHPRTLMAMDNLAATLFDRGQYEAAYKLYDFVATNRQQALGAKHPDTIIATGKLAVTMHAMGKYDAARELQENVVETLRRKLGSRHVETLLATRNLAAIRFTQGAYGEARELEEEVANDLRNKLGAKHPETSIAMRNLAATLYEQGEYRKALHIQRQALADLIASVDKEHPYTLLAMDNMNAMATFLGSHSNAYDLQRAIAGVTWEKLDLDNPQTLKALTNLAVTASAKGEYVEALAIQRIVLAVKRRELGFQHPETIDATHHIAVTFYKMNELHVARDLFESMLMTRRLTYGERASATQKDFYSLAFLGEIYRALDEPNKATQNYLAAIDALERQIVVTGSSDHIRTNFKAKHEYVYQRSVAAFLAAGDRASAFHMVERFRAKDILSLMANRGLYGVDLPQGLADKRRDLDQRYDGLIRLRDSLHPVWQQAELMAVLADQDKIHEERDRLNVEIRRRAPRVAAIEAPPLTAEQVRSYLDAGTLLLSFMTGPEKTYLFVLSSNSELVVHEIDVDESTLWEQAALYLNQLSKSTAAKTNASSKQMAYWFYEKLLSNVTHQIAKSGRLLIIPDGPLFHIPFGLLVDANGKYLAESVAIHTAVSATVYAQIQEARPKEERPMALVAFGNPYYPREVTELNDVVRATRSHGVFGDGLKQLPHSEREVVTISKLYGTRPYIGPDASEERAKALTDNISVIHFAVHGVADSFIPLDSFVALSVTDDPERENGLLQAWEIYEQLRLNADLVVLSACETAFGPEQDGEGLMSLARAFQVAGARTVVASLWSVNDESTAELMIRFHKHLLGVDGRTKKTKAEALRAAQLEFIHGDVDGKVVFTDVDGKEVQRDFSSPYYWAAFQVIGDDK